MRVEGYMSMIEAFLSHELAPQDFERRFYEAFSEETPEMPYPVFQILQDLFEDLDAYTPEWPPKPGLIYVISEDDLRKEALTALADLKHLESS